MKINIIAVTAMASLSFLIVACLVVTSCSKKKTAPAVVAVLCADAGTDLHIGSNTTSGNVETTIMNVTDCELCTEYGSHNDAIGFDNVSLDLYIGNNWNSCTCPGSLAGKLIDAGPQSCPDFTFTGTPVAEAVAYTTGHGYVGIFHDGHTIQFVAGTFSNGMATISYIFK